MHQIYPIIVSDTCAKDPSLDKVVPALVTCLKTKWSSEFTLCDDKALFVADDPIEIQTAVSKIAKETSGSIVITCGGTGFGVRDCTPDAVEPLLERKAPGLVHAMLRVSLEITPFAALSRPVAGIINGNVVVTLPGSPKGATENLTAILGVVGHAADLANGANSREMHSATAHSNQKETGSNHTGGHSHHHHHHHHHDHKQHHGHGHDHQGPTFYKSNDPAAPVTLRARESPYPMIPVPDALNIISSQTPEPVVISKAVFEADITGYVLAEDVLASSNVPDYNASIVDGYALAEADIPSLPRTFPVAHVSLAAIAKSAAILEPGTIARVTTGAPLPIGTGAVIPVENTSLISTTTSSNGSAEEKEVRISAEGVKVGDNVRKAGSDISKGSLVLPKDTVVTLSGGEVGTLASIGKDMVQVYHKPVVGVMSTGNEVIDPLEISTRDGLKPGEIWDSNRPSLLSTAKSWGFPCVDLGIISDEPNALINAMRDALSRVDVLITTGGVSMGELDLLKPTIERELGGTIHFGRVAMKPGKPTTFGTVALDDPAAPNKVPAKKLIFALPGNPASALVTFHLFVLPSLRQASGLHPATLPKLHVELEDRVALDPRPEYHRVYIQQVLRDGTYRLVAKSTGGQRSSRVGSVVGANGLLCLPAGTGYLQAGDSVEAIMIGSFS